MDLLGAAGTGTQQNRQGALEGLDAEVRRGRLAVADSTALHPDARADLRRIARRAGAPVAVIAFDIPEATCRTWDARRERRVGPAVIHRHCEMLQDALRRLPGEGYEQVVVLGEADVTEARVDVA